MTGAPSFQASRALDFENVQYMLDHLAKKQMPYLRYAAARGVAGVGSWLSKSAWVEHQRYAWKTTIRGPQALSRDDLQQITDALFAHATIFRWHAGDVLLIDNIKTAHGRLNIDGKRVLHVFMSAYIDQKALYPDAEGVPRGPSA